MFKEKLSLVPHKPGSYQMKNSDGVIIYVGKAKDLKKRLSSYFRGTHTGKTAKMISEIADFTYIVASSELEAFIIEINLIKKYDPKYNILLKDDKTYPYIEYIKNPYPKLKVSRYTNIKKSENKKLFGPYPNAYAARKIVNLLNRIYPLKKCDSMPKEVCLYYHIGQCLGYCTKNYDHSKLEEMEKEILSFLNGNENVLKNRLLKKIEECSNNLNFEMALELKKDLDYVEIVLTKQKVELHDLVNRDILGYYLKYGYVSAQIFFIRNGKLVGGHNDIFPIVGELKEEIEEYLIKFYARHEIPKEIFLDELCDKELLSNMLNTTFTTPLKGKKKELLDMAFMNAKINLDNEMTLIEKDEERTEKANEELRELLNLEHLNRIDLFDNSNLFGDFSVSAMVVFKNGVPAKKEYRKFKISIDKNDDYNTMKEVLYRRYYRMLLEHLEKPDLIIVDGGINQINACKEIMQMLNLDIKICGLRKNDKHMTNDLIDGDTLEEIPLVKTSNVFHYLTRMQDEVHIFTINYHRQIRSKGSISSVLDNIDGIGEKRKKELIKKFGSVAKMKEAPTEELEKIIPKNIADNLKEYLSNINKK